MLRVGDGDLGGRELLDAGLSPSQGVLPERHRDVGPTLGARLVLTPAASPPGEIRLVMEQRGPATIQGQPTEVLLAEGALVTPAPEEPGPRRDPWCSPLRHRDFLRRCSWGLILGPDLAHDLEPLLDLGRGRQRVRDRPPLRGRCGCGPLLHVRT